MTQPATQTAVQPSRLEQLAQKYHYQTGATAPVTTYQAFDSNATYARDKARLQRISQSPQTSTAGKPTTGDIHQEMAGIQMDLAELAEQYGKLNVDFSSLVGAKKIFDLGETVRIGYNNIIGDKQQARQIKLNAIKRRGDAIEILVEKMAEVLGDQYQKAVKGVASAKSMQVENIAHMKNLDRKLIESLKGGYSGGADYIVGQAEVAKLEAELKDIEATLLDYEQNVQIARGENNLDKIAQLTNEMSQVLDIKYKVLDGRLSAEGIVSDIRRNVLDSTEAVQSAKGAIAASKVNYQAINALIDSYTELEIKYRHAQSDMIPVFKIQAKIASGGLQALDLKDTLVKVANASQRLMEANARMVTHLAAETFELLQTPLYDPAKAQKVEDELRSYFTQLNQAKMDWAQQVQTVSASIKSPHYAKPQ